jgi:TnpA family transposase
MTLALKRAELIAALGVGDLDVSAVPHLEPGTVDWKAYSFCVLEQFHRILRRREIFARNSSKWGDPRAKLLSDTAWEQARPMVLASLNLPGGHGVHLHHRRRGPAGRPGRHDCRAAGRVRLQRRLHAGDRLGRAVTRDRLSHVGQTYLRHATYRAANAALIAAQQSIGLASAWGGALVASIDGMRFVVPVPSVYARPNPKYFGRRGGATWLNMINDQAAGLGGKVVAGTPRDSLYVLDVLYDRDGGRRPEMIVTDTSSYSDIVLGLLTLAGYTYAPQLADLPDQKMWRINPRADYGPFNDAARGRVDLARIGRHWEDILRITGSIHTGAVRAHDVIRMLSRDGRPTPLGDAIAHYGRISKSLHILRMADEPGYRHQIKAQANLQEGRHALARKIFHGKNGHLYQNYQEGMEDQIGTLGLVSTRSCCSTPATWTPPWPSSAPTASMSRTRTSRGCPLSCGTTST